MKPARTCRAGPGPWHAAQLRIAVNGRASGASQRSIADAGLDFDYPPVPLDWRRPYDRIRELYLYEEPAFLGSLRRGDRREAVYRRKPVGCRRSWRHDGRGPSSMSWSSWRSFPALVGRSTRGRVSRQPDRQGGEVRSTNHFVTRKQLAIAVPMTTACAPSGIGLIKREIEGERPLTPSVAEAGAYMVAVDLTTAVQGSMGSRRRRGRGLELDVGPIARAILRTRSHSWLT